MDGLWAAGTYFLGALTTEVIAAIRKYLENTRDRDANKALAARVEPELRAKIPRLLDDAEAYTFPFTRSFELRESVRVLIEQAQADLPTVQTYARFQAPHVRNLIAILRFLSEGLERMVENVNRSLGVGPSARDTMMRNEMYRLLDVSRKQYNTYVANPDNLLVNGLSANIQVGLSPDNQRPQTR